MSNKISNNITDILEKSDHKIKNIKELDMSSTGTKKKNIKRNIKNNNSDENVNQFMSIKNHKSNYNSSDDEEEKKSLNLNKIKSKIEEDLTHKTIKNIELSSSDDELDLDKFKLEHPFISRKLPSDDDDDEEFINKHKSKITTKKEIINEEEEEDDDDDDEDSCDMKNFINTNKNITKIIEEDDTQNNNTETKKKNSKISTKIEYHFNIINEYKDYFKYLNNIENKNNKLKGFIKYMEEIVSEKKIKDLNIYIKNLNCVINNYKLVFGYLIYLKEQDPRTNPEINDLLNIISNLIKNNISIIEESEYVLINKKTTKSFEDKLSPIEYINIETINNIKLFTPVIQISNFCYLGKHINLEDFVNTFLISWYIMFLHLEICKNIISQDETEIKKLKDKCLNIATDTNVYIKSYISFIKRKPKNNKETAIPPNAIKSKTNKANNVVLGETFKNIDIASNNLNNFDLDMNNMDEDE